MFVASRQSRNESVTVGGRAVGVAGAAAVVAAGAQGAGAEQAPAALWGHEAQRVRKKRSSVVGGQRHVAHSGVVRKAAGQEGRAVLEGGNLRYQCCKQYSGTLGGEGAGEGQAREGGWVGMRKLPGTLPGKASKLTNGKKADDDARRGRSADLAAATATVGSAQVTKGQDTPHLIRLTAPIGEAQQVRDSKRVQRRLGLAGRPAGMLLERKVKRDDLREESKSSELCHESGGVQEGSASKSQPRWQRAMCVGKQLGAQRVVEKSWVVGAC